MLDGTKLFRLSVLGNDTPDPATDDSEEFFKREFQRIAGVAIGEVNRARVRLGCLPFERGFNTYAARRGVSSSQFAYLPEP